MMTKLDMLMILAALEAVEAEIEQLLYDKEWYVTSVIDQLVDAKQRLAEALSDSDSYDEWQKTEQTEED